MAIEISVRKKQLESSWQLNTLKNVSEDIKQVLILIRAISRVFWGTLFFEMVIFPCRHNGCEGFLELSTLTWNSGYLPRSHHGWFFENHAQDALKIHSRKCLNKPPTNLSVSYKSNFLLTGAVKSKVQIVGRVKKAILFMKHFCKVMQRITVLRRFGYFPGS